MDYRNLLEQRRSIRNYQPREVPLPLIEGILTDTCLAPTASNRQPCRFIVIRDRGLMRRLSDESKRHLLEDIARDPAAPVGQYRQALEGPAFNVYYNAPCLIFIVGPADLDSLSVDGALTAAYLMFAATERGLGTCWIGLGAHIRDPRIRAEIGLAEGQRIVAPIILGWPEGRIPAASERHTPIILKVL